MQFLNLLLLLALPVVVTDNQNPANPSSPPDLLIEKKRWTRSYPPVGGDRDPFAPNDLMRDQILAAREAAIINKQRIGTNDGRVNPRTVQIRTSSLSTLKPAVAYYSYSVTLKNTGTKTIRTVEWAYVFTDTQLQEQTGRTVSESTVKLRPGKTIELIGYSNNHPVQVVNAKSAGTRNPLKEEVEIIRIDYEDGSVWQRPIVDGSK